MRPRAEVVELRNYITQPGQRDLLIDIFERRFIEPQEKLGASVLGSFRNLDDPNRYVWLRGFANLEARFAALDGFYTSDIWKAHRSAANATMIDSDDVLLLRPVFGNLGGDPEKRAPVGAAPPSSLIAVTTYFLHPRDDEAFAALFAQDMAPILDMAGGAPLAAFTTEHAPNNYPRLPVREGETVFVSIARFESIAAHDAHDAMLAGTLAWQKLQPLFRRALVADPQTLRLQPTARSLLR